MERVDGYRAALRAAGLAYDAGLVRSGGSVVDPARIACRHLLELADPPTAIVTANNLMTIGAMRGLRDAGRRVPEAGALQTPSGHRVNLIDLPGTYSLRGRSPDEAVTRDAVLGRLAARRRRTCWCAWRTPPTCAWCCG